MTVWMVRAVVEVFVELSSISWFVDFTVESVIGVVFLYSCGGITSERNKLL